MRALDEQSMGDKIERTSDSRSYRSNSNEPVRKPGLDGDNSGLSEKDVKTINTANAVIDRHLGILSAAGLGATGAGIVTSGFANDGDSRDNIQDAAVTAGLLGLGGFSGYAAGENTNSQMSEHLAVRHQEAGDTTPIRGRVFARDDKGRASRGPTGALLGARKASQQDEQLRQAAEWFDLTTSRSIAYRL